LSRWLGYDTSWTQYLSVNTKWGRKVSNEARREVYGFCIDALKEYGFKGDVGICKETAEMAGEFGMGPDMKCNCIW